MKTAIALSAALFATACGNAPPEVIPQEEIAIESSDIDVESFLPVANRLAHNLDENADFAWVSGAHVRGDGRATLRHAEQVTYWFRTSGAHRWVTVSVGMDGVTARIERGDPAAPGHGTPGVM